MSRYTTPYIFVYVKPKKAVDTKVFALYGFAMEIREMVIRYREGDTLEQISRDAGMSTHAVAGRLVKVGVKMRSRGRPLGSRTGVRDRPRLDEMRRLCDEGLSYTEIGHRYDITRQAVCNLLKKYSE